MYIFVIILQQECLERKKATELNENPLNCLTQILISYDLTFCRSVQCEKSFTGGAAKGINCKTVEDKKDQLFKPIQGISSFAIIPRL